MIKLFINNKTVTVPFNSSILEACESIGISIPRFCYHERLNVAGNCRMCLVEIENAPKPIASCAYPVSNNLKVFTDTPLVKKARENVLEFLLINHPLDCPICDQGGECDLQDQTYHFGSDRSRFFFNKRGVEDKSCGPIIKTIMTRCIHCTRCVRFFQEITGSEDFGTTLRGQNTEIGAYIRKNIVSELSGNVVDLCPVGALTSKPYAFIARPWELKVTESIDLSDGIGSSIKINTKENEIVRILPVINDDLNEEWITDKARFLFDGTKKNRLNQPYFFKNGLNKSEWDDISGSLTSAIEKYHDKLILLIDDSMDLQTQKIVKDFAQKYNIALKYPISFDKSLSTLLRSNTTLKNLNKADNVLLVGVNPRYDASAYNLKLKKLTRNHKVSINSIGINDNYSYDTKKIGTSLKSLLTILEGRNNLCQSLVKSKTPLIVFDAKIQKLTGFFGLLSILYSFSKNINIFNKKTWTGVDFISPHPNLGSENYSNFLSKSKNLRDSFLYSLELNDLKPLKKASKMFPHIYQNSILSTILENFRFFLPTTNHFEKEGSILNLEGQLLNFKPAVTAPKESRDSSKIVQFIDSCFAKKEKKRKVLAENKLRTDIVDLIIKEDRKKGSPYAESCYSEYDRAFLRVERYTGSRVEVKGGPQIDEVSIVDLLFDNKVDRYVIYRGFAKQDLWDCELTNLELYEFLILEKEDLNLALIEKELEELKKLEGFYTDDKINKNSFLSSNNNKSDFTASLFSKEVYYITRIPVKPIPVTTNRFFEANEFCKNSKVLSDCQLNFVNNWKNF